MADYSPYVQAAAQLLQTVGQAASTAQQAKERKAEADLGFSTSEAQFARNLALKEEMARLRNQQQEQQISDVANANLQNTLVQQSAQGSGDIQGLANKLAQLYALRRR